MVSAIFAVVVLVVGVVIEFRVTHYFTGTAVAKENDSQKKYDETQPPFFTSMQPDDSQPQNWVMLLDRPLTAEETQTLTADDDPAVAFAYLRSLGGRPLAFASPLVLAPSTYFDQLDQSVMEWASTVRMNFLSVRSFSVIIDDWKVVDMSCEPSTAKTVIGYPPQGGAAYEGIRLHIPPLPSEPVLTDEIEGQGEPYFSNRFIEVGGGQSSGGLRIESIARPTQACEWGVEVHYVDAHQNVGSVVLKDRDGNPLRIRTESVPENPEHKWVFGSVPWTPCHENPQEGMCELV